MPTTYGMRYYSAFSLSRYGANPRLPFSRSLTSPDSSDIPQRPRVTKLRIGELHVGYHRLGFHVKIIKQNQIQGTLTLYSTISIY